ncbi:MAG TPA: hypothetical protein VLT87_17815 [Thermoanaerobaculia bacterium]|nr:hypothetical protein [Thermoanaerobaculia bacterium]
MRRILKIGLFALVPLLLLGHVLYWYWPRERAAAPDPGGLPARLLASGAYDACLWAPYPHQNVGVLSGEVEDGSAYLSAVARVAEVPPPVLPSFGPFAVPPASEVTACSDLSGDRFVLVARVYPALGAVARLSGRIAGNPWLEGGEIRDSEGRTNEVVERVLRVDWRDGFWMVSGGGEVPDLSAAPPAGAPHPPGLGIVRLEQEVSEFPPGEYLLERREGDLELTLAGGAPAPERPDFGSEPLPVLLAVAGPSWPAAEAKPLPPAAFALFAADSVEGIQAGPFGRLPGAAILHPPGKERWRLPAQGIAGLLTERLHRGNSAGWRVVALDAGSLARARSLAPGISSLTPPEGDRPDGRLVLGLWLQPRPALRLVAQTRKILEKIPLVDRAQVQRWRDWERIMAPLAPCEEVSLAATQSPASFRLRFHGCG